jgi:hypothetical protein
MKMVYTNENRFLVSNAKNILELQGIDVTLKNEFASSVIGEVSAFDAWVEVWVLNDADYEEACSIIESSLSKDGDKEWVCSGCNEKNDASFEICWNCQSENS